MLRRKSDWKHCERPLWLRLVVRLGRRRRLIKIASMRLKWEDWRKS